MLPPMPDASELPPLPRDIEELMFLPPPSPYTMGGMEDTMMPPPPILEMPLMPPPQPPMTMEGMMPDADMWDMFFPPGSVAMIKTEVIIMNEGCE